LYLEQESGFTELSRFGLAIASEVYGL
jgi:hypothetical protein